MKKLLAFLFCIIVGICALAMCTNNNSNCLYFNGHYYTDQGAAPCPIDGKDNCTIGTTTEDGVPAWWQNGHLYVRDYSKDCTSNAWHIDWSKAPAAPAEPASADDNGQVVTVIGGGLLLVFILFVLVKRISH